MIADKTIKGLSIKATIVVSYEFNGSVVEYNRLFSYPIKISLYHCGFGNGDLYILARFVFL